MGTPYENSQDKFLHNTVLRGEEINHAKLTAEAIKEIRILKKTMTFASIARKFGVCPDTIAAVAKGKTWGHIQ